MITSAPFADRVVHHAICNVIGPVLDRPLIVDSYACRTGKGLHRAIKKAFYWYKNSSWHYKLDISKYYYTIDHAILLEMIQRKVKDPRLLDLLSRLLATYESGWEYYFDFAGDDLFDLIRPRGLPIGNLTSQLFANFYLSGLDHYVREQLHLPGYIRYMDDILVFGKDKADLRNARLQINAKLQDLRLNVNPHKDLIRPNNQGLEFLGFRIIYSSIRLRSQNLARFRRKMKLHSRNPEIALPQLLRSFNGHLGYLKGGHTKKITNRILEDIEFHNDQKRWKLVI